MGAVGTTAGSLDVALAGAAGRCDVAPLRVASANVALWKGETLLRASLKDMFSLTLRAMMSFSLRQMGQVREYAGWAPSQLAQ